MSRSLLQIVRPYDTEREGTRENGRDAPTVFASSQNVMDASMNPPPPYMELSPGTIPRRPIIPSPSSSSGPNSLNALSCYDSRQQHQLAQAPRDIPIVIPQTARSSEGSFHSPFVRSYPPSLQTTSQISQTDFLAFLDNLNSVWVANPALESVGLAGEIMGNLYWLPIVSWVGMGVEIAAGLSSAAASLARSRKFLKLANEKFWKPKGWFVKICGTKEMLGRVGYASGGEAGAAQLKLPPRVVEELECGGQEEHHAGPSRHQVPQEDARTRRMRALEGYVAPLEFNVPALVPPTNLLAKMGTMQAQRMASKQQKKEVQKREKAIEKRTKEQREAENSSRKAAERLDELDTLLEKERTKLQTKLARRGEDLSERDRERILREFEKEEERLEKELEKETKKFAREREKRVEKEEKKSGKPKKDKEEEATQKMRWIVTTRWEGGKDEEGEDGLVVGDDDENEGTEKARGMDRS
ncbi:hypothetical protein CB0940_01523 [Cercospora beticola]|uniref:Uncharacterized protein n=1 Tax=Cercospora beticola TaxID=122368 RepID=A0A2G5ID77_CERBT|nr:hypothetical protein CB0940_01523 [Cercospora beticola]PIB02632.1 hypothetical protein CB0940_01523 [Cercospora beticola]WPA96962.1 hypothetical protein RHO25_001570 [Cercospora beticola]